MKPHSKIVKNKEKSNNPTLNKIVSFEGTYIYVMTFVLIFFFDRITKYLTITFEPNKVEIIPSVLWFTYVENTGATFGLFQGNSFILAIIGIVFIIGITYYIYSQKTLHSITKTIPYIFILAGALGNIIDRIIYSFVIDMIDLGWWPVFNIADIAIVTGVVLILYQEMKSIVIHKSSKKDI